MERDEPALRKPTLQRHLTPFEADLVKAARARLLTLVPASRRLAMAAEAASNALLPAVRAGRRFDLI